MVQEIKMTDEEKYNMFMKLNKEEVVKMLIESNKNLELVLWNRSCGFYTQPPIEYPTYPYTHPWDGTENPPTFSTTTTKDACNGVY